VVAVHHLLKFRGDARDLKIFGGPRLGAPRQRISTGSTPYSPIRRYLG
jgi:hypothetical protein